MMNDQPSEKTPSMQMHGGDADIEAGSASTDTVEQLRREVADKQDRLLRALAEADNIRRRAQRDREDYVRYANESLLRELIPILDNFDRALGAARTSADGDSGRRLLEGVELIQREFLKVLERVGVTRYSALGQIFDPTRHDAISRIVSVDAAPGTVVAETLPGYMLNGRVLRPAMVRVNTPVAEPTTVES